MLKTKLKSLKQELELSSCCKIWKTKLQIAKLFCARRRSLEPPLRKLFPQSSKRVGICDLVKVRQVPTISNFKFHFCRLDPNRSKTNGANKENGTSAEQKAQKQTMKFMERGVGRVARLFCEIHIMVAGHGVKSILYIFVQVSFCFWPICFLENSCANSKQNIKYFDISSRRTIFQNISKFDSINCCRKHFMSICGAPGAHQHNRGFRAHSDADERHARSAPQHPGFWQHALRAGGQKVCPFYRIRDGRQTAEDVARMFLLFFF